MPVSGGGNVRLGCRPARCQRAVSLFLTPEVANAACAKTWAATSVGLREEELQVDRIAVRIVPQPSKPHSAAAIFDLVRMRGGGELARESWSVSMRFSFLPEIPAQLVVHNPMGIVISLPPGRPHRHKQGGPVIPHLGERAAAL